MQLDKAEQAQFFTTLATLAASLASLVTMLVEERRTLSHGGALPTVDTTPAVDTVERAAIAKPVAEKPKPSAKPVAEKPKPAAKPAAASGSDDNDDQPTAAQVREVVTELSKSAGRDTVYAVLDGIQPGARRISEIKPTQYAQLIRDARNAMPGA